MTSFEKTKQGRLPPAGDAVLAGELGGGAMFFDWHGDEGDNNVDEIKRGEDGVKAKLPPNERGVDGATVTADVELGEGVLDFGELRGDRWGDFDCVDFSLFLSNVVVLLGEEVVVVAIVVARGPDVAEGEGAFPPNFATSEHDVMADVDDVTADGDVAAVDAMARQ